ncbi:MAG TPA: hypothetical protein VG125_13935 [Pirellulales bacterium]|jgi:hypothetical protein|nr:hypothetical protein [Pirellulales bacterium]
MRLCHTLVTLTAVLLPAAQAEAGHFCHHCGCQRDCKKVCRLEVKTKKKKEIEYSCECEDFCVPGPSKRCGFLVDPHCDGHPQRKFNWQPKCAKVYTRKKLVATEVTKEVPDYKWVVEEYCRVCGQYIKIEDGDKTGGDKAGGVKGGGDAHKKAEWPPALLSGEGRSDELRVSDNRGYYWGDTPHDRAADRAWPPVVNPGNPPTTYRFSWTRGDEEASADGR